MGMSFV
jgi:hypothetical protein